MKLAANTILITGGAAGIGFALARQLSERGNRVIICGRSEAALRKARELGVDLSEVEGTGLGGQITVDDVRRRGGAR